MGSGNSRAAIEPMPVELLKEPLVWFFAEHYRHRAVCKELLRLAESDDFDEMLMRQIEYFLDVDLALHIVDEEDDLFPLLRRRCEPDDQIENVLEMLAREHASDLHDATAVRTLIKEALSRKRGLAAFSETGEIVPPFCRGQQRHIAVENAVVLPIARMRLTPRDLTNLGRRLAARRGLLDPFERS